MSLSKEERSQASVPGSWFLVPGLGGCILPCLRCSNLQVDLAAAQRHESPGSSRLWAPATWSKAMEQAGRGSAPPAAAASLPTEIIVSFQKKKKR